MYCIHIQNMQHYMSHACHLQFVEHVKDLFAIELVMKAVEGFQLEDILVVGIVGVENHRVLHHVTVT